MGSKLKWSLKSAGFVFFERSSMDDFRDALRGLGRSVVILTAEEDGQRFAMSATAVCELSLDPPSVLVCVNRSASIHAVLSRRLPFAVNVLPHGLEDLANRCAGAVKGEDRFASAQWERSSLGPPVLAAAQAAFVCENEVCMDHGTHTIFIGRVIEVLGTGQRDPLIYVDGRYARASA